MILAVKIKHLWHWYEAFFNAKIRFTNFFKVAWYANLSLRNAFKITYIIIPKNPFVSARSAPSVLPLYRLAA
jgi:hypothetical protein